MRTFFVLLYVFSTALMGQTTLRQYLSLSDQQASAIVSLNIEFQRYDSGKQQRVNTVNSELADLYSQPPADVTVLGLRYVELESIRRDIAAHATTLRSQVDAVLTPTQLPLLQTLRNDAQLQALLNDAQCAFLIAAPANQWFNTSGFGVITEVLTAGRALGPQLPYIYFQNYCQTF
ncbi:MAG: hypothetical protein M3Z23_12695 [Acidobacteriota bacterium]|nr:hypothetical protein [Acidobacteriota bacterium]